MEVRVAESLLPAEPGLAPRWSVAVMELGALICTAERPRCPECPVVSACAWHRAGRPGSDPDLGRRRSQGYEGTDRQCRGRLLAVLRDSDGPVPAARLDAAWPDESQRTRSLASLVADGLAESLPGGHYALPG
jgi:A/G-specific adenine glycosylase